MQFPNDVAVDVPAPALVAEREEIANSVTHGIGLLLSLAGGTAILVNVSRRGDAWLVAACASYAMALVAVYACSTLSHVFRGPPLRPLFRSLDQGFIYLLIAASYTPLALVYLRFGWWWVLLGWIWTIAVLGCLGKIILRHRIDAVSPAIYLLLGWSPAALGWFMVGVVPSGGLLWMLTGGVCYTLGVVFLTLDAKVPFFHAVWHLMVIGGSACHYAAILLYAVLQNA
jgi:hemolysin III